MSYISFGPVQDSSNVQRIEVNGIRELRQFLMMHRSNGDGGSYITPAPMRDDTRSAGNAEQASFVGLDYDDLTPTTATKLIDGLRGARLQAMSWHTRRSTAEKPRLRVMVELARDITPDEYPSAHDALSGELSRLAGVTLTPDSSCRIPCQPLFTPTDRSDPTLYAGDPYDPPRTVSTPSPTVTHRITNADAALLRSALRSMPNDLAYKKWISFGFAIKWELGDSGLQDWLDFSSQYRTFDEDEARRKYAGFNPDGKVTAGTIFLFAEQNGWKRKGGPSITLRTALDIVANPVPARWIHKPYLEKDVIAVMAGDYGTFKSFLALDWCLCAAAGSAWYGDSREVPAIACVYISAEGRGLSKRIRAWVRHHYPHEKVETILERLKFYAVEAAINLSSADRIAAFVSAIDALAETPALIVVDTLTKNSSGEVEETNSSMATFLNEVNASIRMRYRCTVLVIHHVGHTNKDRARGPISLVANTDASFIVERIDQWNVRLKIDRLKDSEAPAPLPLEARVINLGTVDEDGASETSLILARGGVPVKVIPTGENQRKVYDALQREMEKTGLVSYTKVELNALARRVIAAQRLTETLDGLRKLGWIIERAGQWEFVP